MTTVECARQREALVALQSQVQFEKQNVEAGLAREEMLRREITWLKAERDRQQARAEQLGSLPYAFCRMEDRNDFMEIYVKVPKQAAYITGRLGVLIPVPK